MTLYCTVELRPCLLLFYCYLWPQVSFKIEHSTKQAQKNPEILQIAQGRQNTFFSWHFGL